MAVNDYLNNGYHNYADDEDDTDLFDVKRDLNSKEIDYDPNEPLVGAKNSSLSKNNRKNNNNTNGASITSSSSSVLSSSAAKHGGGGGSNSNSSNNLASLPDLIVKSPNSSIHSNTSGGNGGQSNKYMSLNTNSSSRARMAQETLERLEKEKDDLFEL